MLETVKTFAVLPNVLIEKLETLGLSKTEMGYAIKFIENLKKRSFRKFRTIDSFVETPSRYIEKAINKNYNRWLKKLVDSGIILSSNSYSNLPTTPTYSLSYSISNNYYPYIMSLVEEKILCKSVPYTFKKVQKTEPEKRLKRWVTEDFKKLKIDFDILLELVTKDVEDLSILDFKVNEKIERDGMMISFRNSKKHKKYWMSLEKGIQKAKECGLSLVQDGANFFIVDEYEFIQNKRSAIYISYTDAIKNMEKEYYFANRNTTNERLDTNFTNMSKLLTTSICEQNDLVQLDMCNSQFAILSDILENKLDTEDFNIFKQQAYNGTLYEYVQDKLNLEKRKDAKILMFELMFSKETVCSPLKDKLREIFPSVVDYVDNYKEENGYKTFSISLQKRESEIFIDGLWKKLKNKKMFCLSKHDCLIIRRKDTEKVQLFIEQYFKTIDFKGKIIAE